MDGTHESLPLCKYWRHVQGAVEAVYTRCTVLQRAVHVNLRREAVEHAVVAALGAVVTAVNVNGLPHTHAHVST